MQNTITTQPTAKVTKAAKVKKVVTLTSDEVSKLQSLETTIRNGITKFLEVGSALHEIKTRELFRAKHKSFRAYCNDELGLSRQHAYRLVKAVEFKKQVDPLLVEKGLQEASQENVLRQFGRIPKGEMKAAIDVIATELDGSAGGVTPVPYKVVKAEADRRKQSLKKAQPLPADDSKDSTVPVESTSDKEISTVTAQATTVSSDGDLKQQLAKALSLVEAGQEADAWALINSLKQASNNEATAA